MSDTTTLTSLPPTNTPSETDWIDQLLVLCQPTAEDRVAQQQEETTLALAYAASLGMGPPPRCPEESSTRGPQPLRKWGPYYVPRPDGSRRHCPAFLQVKLLKFLLAFEQDCSVKDGLIAANVTRRQYNRWLLAIPNFAADVQDLREDLADDHEKALNQRIEEGDGLALRMQLKAERPEKYDPRRRGPAPPPLPSFPMHKRIDLTKVMTALSPVPLPPTPIRGEAPEPKKKSIWASIEVKPPVLR